MTLTHTSIKDAQRAKELLDALTDNNLELQAANGERVALPGETLPILREALEHLAAQRAVVLIPVDADLSTFDVAALLNVSRPHVTKLLESGAIPFHMVGTHRRVKLEDALRYRDEQRQRSLEALDELTALAQKHGLYD
jgi:excisionase family DNA binding protein